MLPELTLPTTNRALTVIRFAHMIPFEQPGNTTRLHVAAIIERLGDA